jgi:hypothetical protein
VSDNISSTVHLGDTAKEKAQLCSLVEKGIYWEVRFLMMCSGGSIADSPERIRRAIGADLDEWAQAWPAVEPLFPIVDGRRYHQGTLDDFEFKQARRDAGRKGGQQPHPTQRKILGRATVEQPSEQPSSKGRADDQANIDPPSPSPSPSPSPDPSPSTRGPEVCAEPDADVPAATPPGPALLVFPCAGPLRAWSLTESIRAELAQAYPAVDVLACARKALEWCRANPKRIKTAKRMRAWLGSVWCAGDQDRVRITAPARREAVYRDRDARSAGGS